MRNREKTSFYEFTNVFNGVDGMFHRTTNFTSLICDTQKDADAMVAHWNGLGHGKYFYALTGNVRELTKEELNRLDVYAGSTPYRYYLKSKYQ